ncbi:MAG: hypothetical protein V4474_01975 [Patescibacteria group bacterium]
MNKLFAVVLIFAGEALSIGAELVASKRVAAAPSEHVAIFLMMFIPIVVGGALLVAGYMLGYLYVRNIWIIAAVSIGSILVVEPMLAWLLFREIPTTGAAIGLVLGVVGVVISVGVK